MGVTAEAGWQSAVALAWILLDLVSALLVGMLTKEDSRCCYQY